MCVLSCLFFFLANDFMYLKNTLVVYYFSKKNKEKKKWLKLHKHDDLKVSSFSCFQKSVMQRKAPVSCVFVCCAPATGFDGTWLVEWMM